MFTHLYADDTQLYKFFSEADIDTGISQVNLNLQAVCEWAAENKLELNAVKSKAILIGVKNQSNVPAVRMYGVDISFSKFTWADHAAKISQRIFIGLRSLWPLSKLTSLWTRLMPAKSLRLPHLDYCSAVFF